MNSITTRQWKLARRSISYGDRTLVMGILNVTPDSFSDGGRFFDLRAALSRAEQLTLEGADIIDIGGESTRPGSIEVDEEEELRRVIPLIRELSKQGGPVISVDTTRAGIARAAIDAGAEIINDISGLRFDPGVADVATATGAGLVLMHSRGDRDALHRLPPVEDVFAEVSSELATAVTEARERGVRDESIAIDPGIGFGKSHDQNLQLIARLDVIRREFQGYPLLVGTSRKRFIGRLLGDASTGERLHGTMATVTATVLNGADIVRVHDVKAAVDTVRVAEAIRNIRADV
jgi:dihydropteroate synthase